MSEGGGFSIYDATVTYIILPVLAFLCTFLRLCLRARRRRLWWDDGLAFIATIFTGLTSAMGLIHFNAERFDSRTTQISVSFVIAQSFYGSLWCARLSILYTLIRIAPTPSMRKLLRCVAAAMVFSWCILFAQVFWVCLPLPGWTSAAAPQCPPPLQIPVLQLVTTILADGCLIAVPLHSFVNMHIAAGAKKLLVLVFSTSILTTVVSLVHSYYLFKFGGVKVVFAAMLEITVSVMVCNFSVIVPYLNRMCRGRHEFNEIEETDGPHVRTIGSWSVRIRRRRNEHTVEIPTATVTEKSQVYVDLEGRVGEEHNQPGVGKNGECHEMSILSEPQRAYIPEASDKH